MAVTEIRGNNQIKDTTVTRAKLVADFVDGATWNLSSTNTAVLTGLANPTIANDAANKAYVDGLIDSSMKSPDGYATNATGDYPTDYKGTGTVAEGDTFYITSIANGTVVGTQNINVGDLLVALVDTPGNTDANWVIMETNRDQATETVIGMAQIATQTETDAGVIDTDIVTPLKLATYITNANLNKTAGAGMTETAGTFDVVATDASILVAADDLAVQVGTTNGTTLETTATGLELVSNVVGNRTFSGGTFTVSAAGNAIALTSTSTIIADASANDVRLVNHPDGTVPLAVATTQYVDNAVAAGTEVYSELPLVTNGSANVTLANTPTNNSERVYLNGIRQAPGDDYTISGTTVTFASALITGDKVLVDYKYN